MRHSLLAHFFRAGSRMYLVSNTQILYTPVSFWTEILGPSSLHILWMPKLSLYVCPVSVQNSAGQIRAKGKDKRDNTLATRTYRVAATRYLVCVSISNASAPFYCSWHNTIQNTWYMDYIALRCDVTDGHILSAHPTTLSYDIMSPSV